MKKKKVLFICTGNSCRSQMGEAILRQLAGDQFEVYSAGTYPSRVNPMAVTVMEEWGIDISSQTSDPIEPYLDLDINIVITVCDHAEKRCPVFPVDVEILHWSINDPFVGWNYQENKLYRFRDTRAILKEKIEKFIKIYGK